MSTQHVVLGLLAGGPKHGYAPKRPQDARTPRANPPASGKVYAPLARLARDGLVIAAGQDRDGGPDRTSYELTGAGLAAVMTWIRQVEPPMPHLGGTLFAKV